MKHMNIDGISCSFENESNVLEIAAANHIDIPSLCYCKGLSVYGGCRLCIVETDKGSIEAACTLVPKDGMSVRTNTARLRKHRQMILELLLTSHRAECATCEKSGKCKLQLYAKRYGVRDIRFKNEYSKRPVDGSSPAVIRDPSKCILCGKCVRVCSEIMNIRAVDFASRGIDAYISCGFDRKLSDSGCVDCGLCASLCPTGALVIKNEASLMWKALYDNRKPVAVVIDPAVAASIGDEFGMAPDMRTMGKIITALRMLGADYVFDGSFASDIYIEELYAELVKHMGSDEKLPLFASACPSLVKNIENKYPELVSALSTCGSPMEIFGALARQQFADEDVFCAAVVPCTAKKAEAKRPELVKDGERLIDLAITAHELAAMINESGIDFAMLPESVSDIPFDAHTGAGMLGAVSGGITEALIRRLLPSNKPSKISECGVRGDGNVRKFSVELGERSLSFAVVSGLGNADKLIADIKAGESFDFVEIAACPGGCICGSGQPAASITEKPDRKAAVFSGDEACAMRCSGQSHLNATVSDLLRNRKDELLHINYNK